MPLYEYKCGQCGHKFEKLVTASETVPECPACGSNECEKLFSAFSSNIGQGSLSSTAGNCEGCSGGGGFT